ncbi:hypothetical protein, partial [Arthrobacter sp. JCM 19049]|uniref:hypothetical protein n=1 Tax=Arthrobacter sp. JCM 19049 TaxID=1460643 RepID=UPI00243673AF
MPAARLLPCRLRHRERKGEVAGSEVQHRANGNQHAAQVGSRCTHRPRGVGAIDAGVDECTTLGLVGEDAQLEGGALQLALQARLWQRSLILGNGDEVGARRVEGIGDGTHDAGTLGV